jgi:hypothetical protein
MITLIDSLVAISRFRTHLDRYSYYSYMYAEVVQGRPSARNWLGTRSTIQRIRVYLTISPMRARCYWNLGYNAVRRKHVIFVKAFEVGVNVPQTFGNVAVSQSSAWQPGGTLQVWRIAVQNYSHLYHH